MAVQAGNPVNHSAQEICDDFIQQYYDKLKQPDKLYNQDSSFLGRPEPNGTMVDVTTLSAINEKIMSMGFRNGLIEIETANAQFSHMGGVLIVVIGSLTSDEGVCRRFTQSFFLAPQEHGGYFVLNDVFSFVLERKPAEINQVVTLESESSQNRSPSRTCSWVPEPTPLDGNVDSDHVQVVNNVTERQFSNPSSNRTVMEASGNTEPPVRVAQEDPIRAPDGVPPFPAPTLPDVTKKSYASVVKAMKEDPLTPPVAKTIVSAAKHELTPKQVSKAVEGLEKSSAKPTQANETSDGVVDRNNSSCNEQGYSIVVKNLPFNANIEMVEEEFKKFGAIKPGGVQVQHNKANHFVFGFVEYQSQQSLQAAIEASPICMGQKEVCVMAKRSNSQGGCFQSGRGLYHGRGDNFRRGSGYVGSANHRGSENFNRRNERNDGNNYNCRNDGENYKSDSGENFSRRNSFRNQNEFSGRRWGPSHPPGNSHHQNGYGLGLHPSRP
ncbi:unnamed protein product [Urochloa decumbens]|uniref:Uncharacterized protein n=1 Tax=Urochloa decumbens TaxID=240449 RepID=A0ABC8XRS5_9POAL